MKVRTRLGEIDIREEDIIIFDEGIPGFEKLKKFVITSNGSDPIMWLASIEDENVALPIINPWLVRVDYAVEIPKDVMEDLEIEKEEDVNVWAVLVIPKDDPRKMTINLMAPIIINTKKGKGKQVILEGSGYDIRHSVVEEMERSRRIVKEMEKTKVSAG